MSLNSKVEIWETLAQEKYPELLPYQIHALSMVAASDWYNGADTDLAKLFEQYVMIKTLKGIDIKDV